MNAAISARAKMRAGPPGCRELRTAISPPPSSPSSTQSPWGLLCLLFLQTVTRSELAGILLALCDIYALSVMPAGQFTERPNRPTGTSHHPHSQSSLVVLAYVR